MNFYGIIWLQDIVEKLKWKHNVNESEVIELLENNPKFRYIEKGYQKEKTYMLPLARLLLAVI
ncbi:MAG: hypothetical protein SVY10_20595 [Thermodesulfobacteriota bacterium]|nr:hypothetical protein [Thermodesulfobacteriota bacterium]